LIQLRYCTLEFTPDGAVTRFPDGTEIGAHPHPGNHHYHVISHRLGYGDDVLAYCREHELCHSLVEERLHDRPSRVLWALAHGSTLSGRDAAYEELTAQTLQRWLRANERPIISGVRWDEIKRDALEMLDGHHLV
jgi:hypothetical protein